MRKDEVDLNHLVDLVTNLQQPITIIGGSANAVLLSQEDWNGIQETLYLIKIPSMHRSIKQGMAEPLAKSKRILKF
jgi:PHD/YefM family antitoxin component YafN of YafNO toxin-antitoxin module